MPVWLQYVSVVATLLGFPALLAGLARVIWGAAALSATVSHLGAGLNKMETNHLPHIEGEIRELRGMFMAHLDKNAPRSNG